MYPSVTLDVPPNGQPGIYVQGIYLPVVEAAIELDGDMTVRIDSRYVTQIRGIYAAARDTVPADAE